MAGTNDLGQLQYIHFSHPGVTLASPVDQTQGDEIGVWPKFIFLTYYYYDAHVSSTALTNDDENHRATAAGLEMLVESPRNHTCVFRGIAADSSGYACHA